MRRSIFGLLAWAVCQTCIAQRMDWLAVCPIPTIKDFNNGCGSGWNGPLIPDKIDFLGVDFRKSCSEHDQCYSNCLPGGKNFCKPICQEMAKDKREGRRTVCDKQFFSAMTDSCETAACRATAFSYYWTVKILAGGNFAGEELPPSVRQALRSGVLGKADLQSILNDIEKVKFEFGSQSGYKLRMELVNGQLLVNALNSESPWLGVKQVASSPIIPLELLGPSYFDPNFFWNREKMLMPTPFEPLKIKLAAPKTPPSTRP